MVDLRPESLRASRETVSGFSTLRQSRIWELLASAMAEVSPTDTPVTVLDCGGGTGTLSVPLALAGALVCVFDVSVDALAILNRRVSEAGVSDRVTAVQADLEVLTPEDLGVVPTGGFDLIVAHSVLQELPITAVFAAVERLAVLVRPGGLISIVLANPVASVLGRVLSGEVEAALAELRTLVAASDPAGGPAYGTRGPEGRLGLATVHQACESTGLEVVSVCGVGVFTELVPGVIPGSDMDVSLHATDAVTELERIGSELPPFQDIASQFALLARRPLVPAG